MSAPHQAVELTLEDVAGAPVRLAALRGRPLILVYAGRMGGDAALEVGKALHARYGAATVRPAHVVPVVCVPEIPPFLRFLARSSVKRAAEGVVILLDFHGAMQKAFGMEEAEANIALLDSNGRFVGTVAGRGQACIERVAILMDRLPDAM